MGQGSSNNVNQFEVLNVHQRETHFTLSELKKLQKNFLKVGDASGVLHRADFETVLNISFKDNSNASAAPFLTRLFDTFDVDHTGAINFSEFVAGLSVLCRGSLEERTKFAFFLYDVDRKGYITREGLLKVLGSMSRISDSLMAAELSAHRDNLPHTCALTDFAAASVAHSTSPSSTHHHHHHHQQPQPLPEPDMRLFIDRLFTEYASDQTKGLNLFEFTEAVRAHPGLLSYTYDLGAEAEKVEGLYSVKYLVAVDGGEHSLRAFEHIARTARREDFVYVVYVNPRLDPARKPPYMKKEAYIQAHETRTHEMREFLDRCQNLSARNSVAPCQSIFSEGDAIPVISQLLDKYDIDILAMGSHGYGDEMVKSQRKTVGSLCTSFIANSICSVLIVK